MQNQEYTISQTFFCFFEKMLAMSTSWKNFPLIGGLRKLRNPSWGGHFSGLAHILDSFWIIPKCCHHRPILGAWDETILLIIHADTWDPGVLKFELRVLKRGTQLLAPSNSVKISQFSVGQILREVTFRELRISRTSISKFMFIVNLCDNWKWKLSTLKKFAKINFR